MVQVTGSPHYCTHSAVMLERVISVARLLLGTEALVAVSCLSFFFSFLTSKRQYYTCSAVLLEHVISVTAIVTSDC